MKKLYALTDKQRNTLLQAANAMLAGEEGEGDAQGLTHRDLDSAVNALRLPTKCGADSSKHRRKASK